MMLRRSIEANEGSPDKEVELRRGSIEDEIEIYFQGGSRKIIPKSLPDILSDYTSKRTTSTDKEREILRSLGG